VHQKATEAIKDVTSVSAPATGIGTVGGGVMGFLNEYYIVIGLGLTLLQVIANVTFKYLEHRDRLRHIGSD